MLFRGFFSREQLGLRHRSGKTGGPPTGLDDFLRHTFHHWFWRGGGPFLLLGHQQLWSNHRSGDSRCSGFRRGGRRFFFGFLQADLRGIHLQRGRRDLPGHAHHPQGSGPCGAGRRSFSIQDRLFLSRGTGPLGQVTTVMVTRYPADLAVEFIGILQLVA